MFYSGWDGGGTKTEVCIVDQRGAPLMSATFGTLNINGASRESVTQTARDGVACMSAQPGGLEACGGVVIGIAGVSNADAVRTVEQAVRESGYGGPLRLLGDQEIALAGAIEGPGAVLIAGTGAICFGRNAAGKSFRVGGYGYLIDDGGSGYAIGRDILAAVARAQDGRGPATALTELVYEALGADDMRGVVTWLYGAGTGKKEVAGLAALLPRALQKGDAVAKAIEDRAARDLAELVLAGWRREGLSGGELALTGGILTRYDGIRDAVRRLVKAEIPDIDIVRPRGSAARGAAALALSFFGAREGEEK